MKLGIVYIYHSSFSVEVDNKVLLFDYPGGSGRRAELVKEIVAGKELYVFTSHSHQDHFDPSVIDISRVADEVTNIISHDVLVSYPDLRFYGKTVEAKPDEHHRFDGLEVRVFESNDAGVAFLMELDGESVYFGGDLARWDWQEWSEEKRERHVQIFRDTMTTLSKKEITIAFSNMDERLESWAGPLDVMDKVEPEYFVPIHTFGNVDWIEDLVQASDFSEERIFTYEEPGDRWILNL